MRAIVPIILLILSTATAHLNLKHVKCLVCRIIVDEFENEVSQIDPKKKIEIGQYRLDPKGNMLHKKVPMTKSEVHLSEMLDSICKKMEDYVRARYKSNGKLTILKLMSETGLNPLLKDVDIIQDGDLNKSLEYFCEDVVNDNEDNFIKVMGSKEENPKTKICTEMAGYCTDFLTDIQENYEMETNIQLEHEKMILAAKEAKAQQEAKAAGQESEAEQKTQTEEQESPAEQEEKTKPEDETVKDDKTETDKTEL